jgi:hypothetical protein
MHVQAHLTTANISSFSSGAGQGNGAQMQRAASAEEAHHHSGNHPKTGSQCIDKQPAFQVGDQQQSNIGGSPLASGTHDATDGKASAEKVDCGTACSAKSYVVSINLLHSELHFCVCSEIGAC